MVNIFNAKHKFGTLDILLSLSTIHNWCDNMLFASYQITFRVFDLFLLTQYTYVR